MGDKAKKEEVKTMAGIDRMIFRGKQEAAKKEYGMEAAILGGPSSRDSNQNAGAPVVGSSEWAAQKLQQNVPAAAAEVPTGIQPVDAPEGFVRKVLQGNVGRQRMDVQRQGRG